MAEKALKKIEDQLRCSICLDTYSDPKLLKCFHEYCQKCLVKLVVRDHQGQLILACPICRQVTPVPSDGVAGLPSAFRINYLLEIVEEHKKATTDPPASAEKIQGESTPLTSDDKERACCPKHAEKELELYCETCGEVICCKCAIKGSEHHSHNYIELNKAFENYKAEITASLEPMEKQLTTTEEALAELDARCGEISDQQEAIEADVHKTFRQLREVLDVRETKVIGQLHQMTEKKLKDLAVQRDQIETTQARISSYLLFMRKSLETGSVGELLKMKTVAVKNITEITNTFPVDILKANSEADIVFSTSADLASMCQNYGQIIATALPDPSKCCIAGKGVDVAEVREMFTAVLQVINYNGRPCEVPIKSSECELVSEITGTKARGSIERRGQSQYEISYQPTIKGRHQLHIKVEGQHIRASPFSVVVRSPVEKLGIPIQTLYGISIPWDVAFNRKGEVVVTEYGKGCVSVFGPNGKKLQSFGTSGSGQGQFKSPHGVTVDGEGNILVADDCNHRIQKFTTEGEYITAVGTEGSGPGPLQFNCPGGIAYHSSSCKVYVTDNHHVQVLNSDLTFFSTFGKHGSGKGQFKNPRGIAYDSTGKVYVADYGNHRIQVFTAEGKFLRMFGRHGRGRGELDCPVGVAIDTNDLVYVSEGGNHRVSVFTSEGGIVAIMGCNLESLVIHKE